MSKHRLNAILALTHKLTAARTPGSRRFAWLLGAFACFELVVGSAQAAGLPLIVSATVDYPHGTLTINGQNFGLSPVVVMNSLTFPTQSTGSSQIVADFPSANPPSSFAPGTYFLLVTYKNQLPTIFEVAIGANGPQGPAGAQGPAGLPGSIGATGPAGPVGPQGVTGPIGPAGATGTQGSPGVAGPQGLQGPPGATGATGPQGPQGVAGNNGTNGTGVPACDRSSPYLVISSGLLACQSRFNNNGDGTVTDNQTGLMWEMQTSNCSGEVTCVTNSYTYSFEGGSADGKLFTNFLATLNQDVSADGSATCFANHCDWRIPNVVELQGILLAPYPCGTSPCIDPAFGPTQPSKYWSSSSLAGFGWAVSFVDGLVKSETEFVARSARAVRGGR